MVMNKITSISSSAVDGNRSPGCCASQVQLAILCVLLQFVATIKFPSERRSVTVDWNGVNSSRNRFGCSRPLERARETGMNTWGLMNML